MNIETLGISREKSLYLRERVGKQMNYDGEEMSTSFLSQLNEKYKIGKGLKMSFDSTNSQRRNGSRLMKQKTPKWGRNYAKNGVQNLCYRIKWKNII